MTPRAHEHCLVAGRGTCPAWQMRGRHLTEEYEYLPDSSEVMICLATAHMMERRLTRRPQPADFISPKTCRDHPPRGYRPNSCPASMKAMTFS